MVSDISESSILFRVQVLILVVMEDGLRLAIKHKLERIYVLILVVMEDGLRRIIPSENKVI